MGEATWQLLEERRTYRGSTREAVAAEFAAELELALAEGYQAVSLDWQDDYTLAVTYEYDPKHAPRPIQRVRSEP